MIRKFGVVLFSAACLFTCSVNAAAPMVFRTGPAVEYVLNSNEPQLISNQFLWTVRAVCKIKSHEEDGSLLSFKVLRRTGSFNGENLSEGDNFEVIVHDSDKIYITAVSGAQVEMVNLSEETVKAECSVM